MWIFIWLLLSAILLSATGWSLQILIRQKRAWGAYAKSKNLTFKKGTFMGPAEINGVIGDFKLAFFTAERAGVDIRQRRYVTALEVDVMDGLIDGGVAGTTEMLTFMKSLDRLHPFKIEAPEWGEGMFVFVRNDDVFRAYATPPRLDALAQILKTKNADVIVIFNDREFIVRLETPDPMQDPTKIDKIVTRIMSLCDKLRITPEERKIFTALAENLPGEQA